MSGDGFDFRPPPPRREARQFEPPPWERDQFEELARQRAEQEQAEREAALAAAEIAGAVNPDAKPAQPASGTDAEPAETPVAEAPSAPSVAVEGQVAPAAPKAPKVELDPKQVELMMLELRAEEPETLRGAWVVNVWAGGVVALVGLVVGVWGAMALANNKYGPAGSLGGTVMVVFGLGFTGIGGWLIYRALRQRGVL